MLFGASNSEFSFNWVVLFPVVTGFLAVCYLLPTPRRRPLVNAVLGVVVAVLGFGTFLFHGFGDNLPCSAEAFLFVAFSLLVFTFGILMIVQRNPARAALFFAVVVLSVCGLFLLLAAPFLMAATIIIYAGAIIVTFLFVIMLSQQTRQTDANDRSREPSLAAAVGFVLLGTLLVVLQRVYRTSEVDELIRLSDGYAQSTTVDDRLKNPDSAKRYLADVKRVREGLGYDERLGDDRIEIPSYVDGIERRAKDSDAVDDMENALGLDLPPAHEAAKEFDPDVNEVRKASAQISFELTYLKAVRQGRIAPRTKKQARMDAEGTSAILVTSKHGLAWYPTPADDPATALPHRLPNANVAALGRALFTDHLIAVELAGTLLLVATIGAIAIAGGRSEKNA